MIFAPLGWSGWIQSHRRRDDKRVVQTVHSNKEYHSTANLCAKQNKQRVTDSTIHANGHKTFTYWVLSQRELVIIGRLHSRDTCKTLNLSVLHGFYAQNNSHNQCNKPTFFHTQHCAVTSSTVPLNRLSINQSIILYSAHALKKFLLRWSIVLILCKQGFLDTR